MTNLLRLRERRKLSPVAAPEPSTNQPRLQPGAPAPCILPAAVLGPAVAGQPPRITPASTGETREAVTGAGITERQVRTVSHVNLVIKTPTTLSAGEVFEEREDPQTLIAERTDPATTVAKSPMARGRICSF